MKNSIQIKTLILAIILTVCNGSLYSQSSSSNNTPAFGKFLGYDAGGIDLDFKTNNINRMKLMQTSTSTVDGYAINNSGFLGLSIDPNWLSTGEPYSLLHLHGEFVVPSGFPSQEFGYRSWMRPGITFTHNGDLMYVGPRRNSQDVTDAVIAWSDNAAPGSIGPDVLRFLFTAKSGGSTTISNDPMDPTDFDGVEGARITGDAKMGVGPMWSNKYLPHRSLDVIRRNDASPQFRITYNRSTNVNSGTNADFQVSEQGNLHLIPRINGEVRAVAIGFFDDPSNQTDPLQSTFLDVGGRTRIRDLQASTPRTLIMGYQFEDVNDGDNDHFLGRLDFPTEDPECLVLNGEGEWTNICDLTGGADCRWEDIPSGSMPGVTDMITGVDNQDPCYRGRVGIGIATIEKAKLDVENMVDRDESFIGIYGNSVGFFGNVPMRTLIGILGNAESDGFPQSLALNIGVRGEGRQSLWTIGVDGKGLGFPVGPASTISAMGVRGTATGALNNYGVYGEMSTGQPGFAGYFVGPVSFTGPAIFMSDESVKNEVEDLTDATSILTALQPKTYYYQSPENRPMNFDEEMQYGFIAQEVQEIIPTIVKMTHTPELTDSLGIIEGTSVDLLGIQYQSIIPILVAGFKEQSTIVGGQAAQIASQNETIATLEAELEAQASQLEEMQNDMNSVLAAVQIMQQKTANCCTAKTGSGETGALINENHKELELEQNVPNPFDDQTRIAFNLPKTADVILEITDATGRPLERLIDGKMSSGEHTIIWDGSKVASGIYFYTLYADGELITKKMIKQ